MAEMNGVRFSDELQAKIMAEAKQKECSISQIIREKIEWAYALEDIKELKEKLIKLEAVVLEIAPQSRRADNLSALMINILTEYIKCDLNVEKFRNIEYAANEKYKDYPVNKKLIL
jgi:Tfp pilus assembly protein PilO